MRSCEICKKNAYCSRFEFSDGLRYVCASCKELLNGEFQRKNILKNVNLREYVISEFKKNVR